MTSRIVNKIRRIFGKKMVVLMYHRIAELEADPWQLAVSPSNFEQQLSVLSKRFKVISVKTMASQLTAGSILHKGICITFDDGYRDNFLVAKPLLEKYNCPATFFIESQHVDSEEQFWWDELEDIILNSAKLPPTFSARIHGDLLNYTLENGGVLTSKDKEMQKSWVWPHKPVTQRCEIYLAIWERLKPLPFYLLKPKLEEIKLWAGNYKYTGEKNLAMNAEEINNILSNPLFDIGIHTITHPALASHSLEIQRKEISGSKEFLEQKFKRPLNTIAYPYGNYNSGTTAIAGELQLAAAFTTEEKIIMSDAERYRLGRFQVKNWNGEEFEKHLYQWLKRF